MTTPFTAAAIQMFADEDKQQNIARAVDLTEQAATQGARLVVLPEYFNCLGNLESMVAQAEPIGGPTYSAMGDLAKRLEIVLVAGSFSEASDISGKAYNTSCVFGPTGKELSRYRKIHLFDANVPGEVQYEESNWVIPGESLSIFDSPFGRLGQATCYDLRFPELFRSLTGQGMQTLVMGSAFAYGTGKHHWEVLLRARAIENQVFVVSANTSGQHTPNYRSYGHSMIIDPWGKVLASAEEGDAVVVAEIDLARLTEVRTQMPCQQHRRDF